MRLISVTARMYSTLVVLLSSWLLWTHVTADDVTHQCGVPTRSIVRRIHGGWDASKCQWPWHVALFRKTRNGTSYRCGGTLLDQRHILTAAHCVVDRNRLPLEPNGVEVHLGQHDISEMDNPAVQVAQVAEVHVHPEFSAHWNDLAVLKLNSPVEYSDSVIPICLSAYDAEKGIAAIVGRRGWIAGWGRTDNETMATVLQTAQMPVVDYMQCLEDDRALFGNLLSADVFCAGDRNGTSAGRGDSGGGMFFVNSYGRWVLQGVTSLAANDRMRVDVNKSKFMIFVNVQRYLPWIQNITQTENILGGDKTMKRISETECERFEGLSRKRFNGACMNGRYPQTVGILNRDNLTRCSGVLVKEDFVLTACHCVKSNSIISPTKVQIEHYGDIDIEQSICHPNFTIPELYHDLAILRLSEPVKLSANLIPACLANYRSERLHDALVLTAIRTDIYTGIKQLFESNENRVITSDDCQQLLTNAKNVTKHLPKGITASEFCVLNANRLRTHCRGITGGPLQAINADQRSCVHPVVGIKSAGSSDHQEVRERNATEVDVHIRIAHYLDWIEEIVWGQ